MHRLLICWLLFTQENDTYFLVSQCTAEVEAEADIAAVVPHQGTRAPRVVVQPQRRSEVSPGSTRTLVLAMPSGGRR